MHEKRSPSKKIGHFLHAAGGAEQFGLVGIDQADAQPRTVAEAIANHLRPEVQIHRDLVETVPGQVAQDVFQHGLPA